MTKREFSLGIEIKFIPTDIADLVDTFSDAKSFSISFAISSTSASFMGKSFISTPLKILTSITFTISNTLFTLLAKSMNKMVFPLSYGVRTAPCVVNGLMMLINSFA